jgi:hypothetical protein
VKAEAGTYGKFVQGSVLGLGDLLRHRAEIHRLCDNVQVPWHLFNVDRFEKESIVVFPDQKFRRKERPQLYCPLFYLDDQRRQHFFQWFELDRTGTFLHGCRLEQRT